MKASLLLITPLIAMLAVLYTAASIERKHNAIQQVTIDSLRRENSNLQIQLNWYQMENHSEITKETLDTK